MNTMPKTNPIKRRIIYVDEKVQRGLLIALVMLEVLLIAATLYMLYAQMSGIIDANLYRVHFSDKPNIYPILLNAAIVGVLGLIAVNALVLWVASWVWSRYIDSILKPFGDLIGRVQVLDFSEDVPIVISHHVVGLALAWRRAKRQDFLRLRQEVARLEEIGDLSDAEARARASAILKAIRGLLPN